MLYCVFICYILQQKQRVCWERNKGALFQKDYLKGFENTMGRTIRKATERSGVGGNLEAK